jgi:hypothetical protein
VLPVSVQGHSKADNYFSYFDHVVSELRRAAGVTALKPPCRAHVEVEQVQRSERSFCPPFPPLPSVQRLRVGFIVQHHHRPASHGDEADLSRGQVQQHDLVAELEDKLVIGQQNEVS